MVDERGAADGRQRVRRPAAVRRERVSVRLREVNGSGVSGAATLTASGARTTVAVIVGVARDSLPAYIRLGGCDAPQLTLAYPLTDVYPGRTATTTVDARLDELLGAAYAITVHRRSPDLATLQDPDGAVACGELPGTGGDAPAAGAGADSPPTAGTGTAARRVPDRDGLVVGLGVLAFALAGVGVALRRAGR